MSKVEDIASKVQDHPGVKPYRLRFRTGYGQVFFTPEGLKSRRYIKRPDKWRDQANFFLLLWQENRLLFGIMVETPKKTEGSDLERLKQNVENEKFLEDLSSTMQKLRRMLQHPSFSSAQVVIGLRRKNGELVPESPTDKEGIREWLKRWVTDENIGKGKPYDAWFVGVQAPFSDAEKERKSLVALIVRTYITLWPLFEYLWPNEVWEEANSRVHGKTFSDTAKGKEETMPRVFFLTPPDEGGSDRLQKRLRTMHARGWAGTGWSEVDMSDLAGRDFEEILQEVKNRLRAAYGVPEKDIRDRVETTFRYLLSATDGIRPGDVIAVRSGGAVYGIGVALSSYRHSHDLKELDIANGVDAFWFLFSDNPEEPVLSAEEGDSLPHRGYGVFRADKTRTTILDKLQEHLKLQSPEELRQRLDQFRMLLELTHTLQHFPNLILAGPPGTGKTWTAKQLAYLLITRKLPLDNWEEHLESEELRDRWALVQFHPAYHYEDFIRGIQVSTEDGQVVYETRDRIFLEMAKRAQRDPKHTYVLIIDEINRANLPAVLGELIYALEYRGSTTRTIHGGTLVIPSNLLVIGTMNTADRSAGRLDYAVRRRFVFHPMPADLNRVAFFAQPLMKAVNDWITEHAALDVTPEDILVGHTYFMGDRETIARKFLYQVVPLLAEYVADGLLNPKREEGGITLALKVGENEHQFFLKGMQLHDPHDQNGRPLTVDTVQRRLLS